MFISKRALSSSCWTNKLLPRLLTWIVPVVSLFLFFGLTMVHWAALAWRYVCYSHYLVIKLRHYSVQQLWDDLRIDCAFRDINSLLMSGHDSYGHLLNARIPFNRHEGLSQLQVETRVTPSKLLNDNLSIWCSWSHSSPGLQRAAASEALHEACRSCSKNMQMGSNR